jgi:hypothetical protein
VFIMFVFLSILALIALVARPVPAPRPPVPAPRPGVPADLLALLEDAPDGREEHWVQTPASGRWVQR